MRMVAVLLALLLSACAGAYHTPSDGRLTTRINTAYATRDACLARNAEVDNSSNPSANVVAKAVARACTEETEQLVDVSNRDGDPRVATNIRRDSEFRALGYVLRLRGEVTN